MPLQDSLNQMDDIDYYVSLSKRLKEFERVAIITKAFLDSCRKPFHEMSKEDWQFSDKLWLHLNALIADIDSKKPEYFTEPFCVDPVHVLRTATKDDDE